MSFLLLFASSGLPNPPAGYAYLLTSDGKYVTASNGALVLANIELSAQVEHLGVQLNAAQKATEKPKGKGKGC